MLWVTERRDFAYLGLYSHKMMPGGREGGMSEQVPLTGIRLAAGHRRRLPIGFSIMLANNINECQLF